MIADIDRMDRMAAFSREQITTFVRGISLRQVRLVSGMVLFAYLISHFLNHALGNVSMEALAGGVYLHTSFWQFLPVAILFYAACLVHTALGIWALYERRQFRWKAIEPLQLVLGLSVPMLVIAHIIGVRLGQTLYGHEKLYPQVLFLYWVCGAVPDLADARGHDHRLGPRLHRPLFLAADEGVLQTRRAVPARGGRADSDARHAGFLSGRTKGHRRRQRANGGRKTCRSARSARAEQQAVLDRITDYFLIGYFGLIGIALLARGARAINERRRGMINLSYGNGRTVRVPKGLSVLEASLRNNVPHASVCGGRARCSTCRIRIIGDHSDLPEPSQREAFVLGRVGTSDPSIRLACQLQAGPAISRSSSSSCRTRCPPTATSSNPTRIGQERYLVSMFVDMRGSTKLAEKRLPFDTVFIVNRFLGAVSQAVLESGGMPNQFVGDGMLALFGLSTTRQEACRQALRAAAMIAANVDELNKFLEHDLREPIRFGIGINGGEVIVGDIGYRDHMVFTALGDAVNVAARLQDMTKSLACEVVVSDEVRATAGLAADALPQQEVEIRGRNEPMIVRAVTDARMLPALVNEEQSAAA